MKASLKVAMKAKKTNILTLIVISIILQMMVCNAAYANEDEIDADFLEFLADMEEITGSGFDAWLEDTAIDDESNNTNDLTESIEFQK